MNKRKVIIPAGYMGSGSSAATDMIREFKNTSNEKKEFEFVLLHCPDGVFDLEDKILRNNNSIRSDEAIHAFYNVMKDLYDNKYWWPGNYKQNVGEDFIKIVEDYINKLVDVKIDNHWYYQEKPNARMVMQIKADYALNLLTKGKKRIQMPVLYKGMSLCYKSPEEFYEISKEFINNFLNLIDHSGKDIIVDQLLMPHNAYRIDNYFDENVRVVIVDRDPRDVFVLNKYVWYKQNWAVPLSMDVNLFCKQYKRLRQMENTEPNKKVLRVHFEDLVYNYDKMEDIMCDFLGYSKEDHIDKFKYFDPKRSINNTQLFTIKEYEEEVKVIERELKEYCYDFKEAKEANLKNVIG